MCTNKNSKTRNEHLNLINQKFDELDELITNYLNDLRKNGGTAGFCIGSLREKIRYYRGRINNMCGKFSEQHTNSNLKLLKNTSSNPNINSNKYWESNLLEYLTQKHPDKIKYNPALLKVTEEHIVFGIKKHMGIFIIPKKTIIETLFPNLN